MTERVIQKKNFSVRKKNTEIFRCYRTVSDGLLTSFKMVYRGPALDYYIFTNLFIIKCNRIYNLLAH